MRCHSRRGERATALHLYQQCASLLKKELGIQPSAATRITYREILDVDAMTPVVAHCPGTAVYPLVGRQSDGTVAQRVAGCRCGRLELAFRRSVIRYRPLPHRHSLTGVI